MKTKAVEERILVLVKEKPMLIGKLEAMLGVELGKFGGAIEFLGKYRLIDLLPSGNEEGPLVRIMPRGLQLLDLPDLPEEEITGEEITELTLIKQKMSEEEPETNWWKRLRGMKKEISQMMSKGEGTITIELREDKYILTAIIPKKEGALHLQEGDITKCHHTPEEVKQEVNERFERKWKEEIFAPILKPPQPDMMMK